MKSRLKLLGLVAAPALLAAAVPTAYAAGTAQPHSTRAAINGDVLKGLNQDATHTGGVAAGKRISVAISLTPRNDKALDTFVAKVSNPRSSSYGHYLTKHQFAARFGRTDAEIKQLKDYLHAQGLTVGTVHSGNLLVDASGTAAQLQKAFGTKLSTWKDAKSGRSFYANDTAPTLPTRHRLPRQRRGRPQQPRSAAPPDTLHRDPSQRSGRWLHPRPAQGRLQRLRYVHRQRPEDRADRVRRLPAVQHHRLRQLLQPGLAHPDRAEGGQRLRLAR
ncbi:protease pro-enzyme activation domain-containing protein (plasmid) [Streptomyces sp. NBC_01340]|uniref:protease pro-enzyme activation domain-containing protein n=1 Tax=Streptomyces sp. NBC_01340 TaxID=2903830 RepID=UPI002E14EF01|nr:protease pro-enzyme activation domain-containing protein [Streptomyces sp. NBC_01340]